MDVAGSSSSRGSIARVWRHPDRRFARTGSWLGRELPDGYRLPLRTKLRHHRANDPPRSLLIRETDQDAALRERIGDGLPVVFEGEERRGNDCDVVQVDTRPAER
jgi:hypothetical protein